MTPTRVTEPPVEQAVDLKLEIERISLLYRQNVQGLLALFAFAAAYLIVSWKTTPPAFLFIWSALLFLSALGRVYLTRRWRLAKASVTTKRQCSHWEWAVQSLILVSGCAWGALGWRMPYETTGTQIVSCVAIVLMTGGAFAAYSSSYRTMMLVCFSAFLLWATSLFIAGGHVYQIVGVMLVFMLVLSTMVGWNLSRYILRGLALNVENSRLAERLESKVYSLEKAQEELRRTEALRREQSEIEASNRARSALLANASHEIRTPLAAINGFTDMLLQNPTLGEDVRADLRMILRNGKYLVSLVNDLLDLSKIENGQIYIQKSSISPQIEIQDIVALMRPMIEGKGLAFDVDIGPLPLRIHTDSTRMREILINLLTNAVKFTDRGSVRLRARFEGSRLNVRISDTGIGISEDAAKTLFHPFSRGESERVQRVRGSGLGLALSRTLARLLGGDLRLISSAEGRGTEFEMSIDGGHAVEAGAQDPNAPAASVIATAKAAEKRLSGRDILVVDDSKDLQILMRRFLEKQGAHVDVRENGLEAVETTKDHAYDLVLMDIKMPVLDGYAATKSIRERGYTQPIVAVTAHASTDDRQRCFQSGFDSYVSKPVDFNHLVDDLSKFLP